MPPGANARGRGRWSASLAAEAGPKLLRARLHLTMRGNDGKDHWWYGIEPAGSDHNELLPLNLPGQDL